MSTVDVQIWRRSCYLDIYRYYVVIRKVHNNRRLGCSKKDEIQEAGVACTQRFHNDGGRYSISVGLINMSCIVVIEIKTRLPYYGLVKLMVFTDRRLRSVCKLSSLRYLSTVAIFQNAKALLAPLWKWDRFMQHKDKQSPNMYIPADLQNTSHHLPLLAASVPLINQLFIPRLPSIAQKRVILPGRRLDQDLSEFY